MLKPIPAKIMRSTATVKACTGIDRYQNPTYTEYTVKKVHLQPTNEIRKTADNTDCTLRSILFVDKTHSTPTLDWWSLFNTAHDMSGDVKVIVRGQEYTVFTVDELRDDTDCFHHWEIGLR
jgi:hypothetical protein